MNIIDKVFKGDKIEFLLTIQSKKKLWDRL